MSHEAAGLQAQHWGVRLINREGARLVQNANS